MILNNVFCKSFNVSSLSNNLIILFHIIGFSQISLYNIDITRLSVYKVYKLESSDRSVRNVEKAARGPIRRRWARDAQRKFASDVAYIEACGSHKTVVGGNKLHANY